MTAAGRPVRHALVGREVRAHELFVVLGNPSGDADERVLVRLAGPSLGDQQRDACEPSCTATARHAAGNHSCGLPEQGIGHLPRFERRVDRSDQLNQRVAAIQPVLQSARRMAKPCGQICLSAAGGGWIGARCSRHLREKANSR